MKMMHLVYGLMRIAGLRRKKLNLMLKLRFFAIEWHRVIESLYVKATNAAVGNLTYTCHCRPTIHGAHQTTHFPSLESMRSLTPSTSAVPSCCCSKGSAPYWSNPSFLISDIPVHPNVNKRLCYCRGTARRATSVQILWPFFDWAIDKKLC